MWDRNFTVGGLESLFSEIGFGTDSTDSTHRKQPYTALDICTVRADSISESSLGNLFWVTLAKYLELCGINRVYVHDFYSPQAQTSRRDGADKTMIRDLCTVFDFGNCSIDYADQVNTPQHIFDALEFFAQGNHHSDADNEVEFHGPVSDGFEAYRQGNAIVGKKLLERLAGELAVFSSGIYQAGRLQLMNHEAESMFLIRDVLYPDSVPKQSKQFWRINLAPVKNEYRGNVATVGDFDRKLMVGHNQFRQNYAFYQATLELLARTLFEMALPLPDDEARLMYISDKVRMLNENLLPFIALSMIQWMPPDRVSALAGFPLITEKNLTLGEKLLLEHKELAYDVLTEMNRVQKGFDARDVETAAEMHIWLYAAACAQRKILELNYGDVIMNSSDLQLKAALANQELETRAQIDAYYHGILKPHPAHPLTKRTSEILSANLSGRILNGSAAVLADQISNKIFSTAIYSDPHYYGVPPDKAIGRIILADFLKLDSQIAHEIAERYRTWNIDAHYISFNETDTPQWRYILENVPANIIFLAVMDIDSIVTGFTSISEELNSLMYRNPQDVPLLVIAQEIPRDDLLLEFKKIYPYVADVIYPAKEESRAEFAGRVVDYTTELLRGTLPVLPYSEMTSGHRERKKRQSHH